MLKDRDYDVAPYIIAHIYPQMSGWAANVAEVGWRSGMVGEEWEEGMER